MSTRFMFKVRKIAEKNTEITSGHINGGIFRCPICLCKRNILMSYEGAVEYGIEHLLDNHILKKGDD